MLAIFTTLILLIYLFIFAKPNTILNNRFTRGFLLFFLIITLGISMFLINIEAISDLNVYAKWLHSFAGIPLSDTTIFENKEPLFFFLQWTTSQMTDSVGIFLIVIWLIFSSIFLKALRNLFNPNEVLVIFLSYTSFFIFFNYVLNTMRQGIAISLLVLAISTLLYNNKQTKVFFLSIIAAPLFHITALPLSLILLIFKIRTFKMRTFLAIWIASAILFVTGLNSSLFSRFQYSLLNFYTTETSIDSYGSVNRLDFMLFSAIFLFIGLAVWYFNLKKDKDYGKLLMIYAVFNSYFLLLGFISYSDRIAAYSWFLIPILVYKSIGSETKSKRLKLLIALSLFLLIGIATGSYDIIFKTTG